jgi:hypothetical protein
MMQKDPHMRTANCDEVLTELEKIFPKPTAGAQEAAPAAPGPDPAAAQAVRMEKEGLLWIKFGAFILAAAVIGGGYLIFKSRQEPPPPPVVVKKPRPEAQPAPAPVPEKAPEPTKPVEPAKAPVTPPEKSKPMEPVPTPESIFEKIMPPPITKPPQTIGVRDPNAMKTGEFMAAEAEAFIPAEKERLTLTSQQNVFLKPDFSGVAAAIENQVGQPIEFKKVKVKVFVFKCTPVEATLAVRVYQLIADPRAGFQFNRTPMVELSLKPSEHGYFAEFDATEEFNRCRAGGENHGLVLMTSQGGEAVFVSSMFADQKLWPALEVSFVPSTPPP